MSSRKTLDIDLLTIRKVYPVGPTNRPQPANTVFTVNSAGEGVWVNPIDNLVANGINPPLPTQLSTMQTDIATLNGAVFGGIDPHDEFVTKTEFMSTLVSPLPSNVLAPKGIIAGPDPSSNMLGIVSKNGLSVQNSGFNYWVATGGSEPLKEILTTTDFATFTGQSGLDFNTAPSGITPQCYTIATNGSIWVAGGTSNNSGSVKPILISYDGITWSSPTWIGVAMQSACYTIKYNGSIWVAVGGAGSSNPIYYSMDGIVWEPSTGSTASSPYATIKALDYTNNIWYVIGDDKYLYTSVNGTQWSKSNNMIPTISNTTYALRVYYIPSNSGIYSGGTRTNNIVNTSDTIIGLIGNSQALYTYNIAANQVTAVIPNFSCQSIDTNGLMWVAVGSGVTPNTNSIYYTSNISGASGWTAITGLSFRTGTSVSWTGSEWLCTGKDGAGNNYIYGSNNGISWSLKKNFTFDEQGVEVINQVLSLPPAVYVAPGQRRIGIFTEEPNATVDIQGDVLIRDTLTANGLTANNLTVNNTFRLNNNLTVDTIYTNNISSRTGQMNMGNNNLVNINNTYYTTTSLPSSYGVGMNNTNKFRIGYGATDVLLLDGSASVITNAPVVFNNPENNIIQGRIATDGFNSGYLYAEAINTFMITSMGARHRSARFDVSGVTPSITLFDRTTVDDDLTVTGTVNASNVNVTGLLDTSNLNVSNTTILYDISVNNNLEVFNTVNMRTCNINGGPISNNTELILGKSDPTKYWKMSATSLSNGILNAGNFSLLSYDSDASFIGKAIDIDASCNNITLCNSDISGIVYVNGPSGLGRVYDTVYNIPTSLVSNVTTVSYNTSGIHYFSIPIGNYSITIEYCGGGGGGGYTIPASGPGAPKNGGGGGSGTIKKYFFTTTPLTSGYNITITIGAGGTATTSNVTNGGDTTIQLIYYTLVSAPGGSAASGINGGAGGYGGYGGTSDALTIGTNGSNNDTNILSSNTIYNSQGIGGGNGLLYGGAGGNGSMSGYNNVTGTPYYTAPQPGQDGYAVIILTRLS